MYEYRWEGMLEISGTVLGVRARRKFRRPTENSPPLPLF